VKGGIFRFRPGRDVRGREQQGPRYCLVVLNPDLSHLSTWLVIPTSTSVRPASFRPAITVAGAPTRAMCEQMRAVDPTQRLGERVGVLGGDEMSAVDEALRLVLDLDAR